jgi:hypothetical protein
MPFTIDPQFRKATLPSVPFDMDFSNDGTLLACATQSNSDFAQVIQVVQTKDGSVLTGYMQLGVEHGRGVAFVGGGRELVFLFEREGSETQLCRVALDSRNPTELKTYPMTAHNHSIVRDRSGARFAVLGNHVEIWDAKAGKVLHTLAGADRDQAVHAAFSRDGAHIYVYGTVESAIVRYQVDTGQEVARWTAPTPFGAQVLVSQDERYLLAAATSHRGAFVYDLASGKRLEPAADSHIKLDLDSVWRPWLFTQDSQTLVCLMVSLVSLQLPDLVEVSPPDDIVAPRIHARVAAAAWDAPVIGFGTMQDSTVRWFQLQPGASK